METSGKNADGFEDFWAFFCPYFQWHYQYFTYSLLSSGQFFDEEHLRFSLHRPGADDGFEIEGFVDMTEV